MKKTKWALGFTGVLSLGLCLWLVPKILSQTDTRWVQAEVAVVLGAAVHQGEPSPVFAARLDHAISLYQKGLVKRLLLTGGKGVGKMATEAEVGQTYATNKGVDMAHVWTELHSRTTVENLVFALPLLEKNGVRDVLIVSDPLHLARASLIATTLGIAHQTSATPTSRYQSLSTQLPFLFREMYFYLRYALLGI